MVPQQVSFVERLSLSQRVPHRRFYCTHLRPSPTKNLAVVVLQGIKKFGEMLRNHGDEIDGDPNLERAVVSIAAKLLENTSVLQVSQAMFDGLCDKVLNSIAPRDGGQQVHRKVWIIGRGQTIFIVGKFYILWM